MEAERLARLLQRRVEPHIGIVPNRFVARGGDGEADHAGRVGETLDRLHASIRLVEGQIEQRLLALVLRQNFLDQPAVIGIAKRHLGVGLRVHAEREHRRWKHHHVIDAEGIHGALSELHLAVQPGRRRLAQVLLVHDAAGHVLVKRTVGVEQAGTAAAFAERLGNVAQNFVVDAVGDFGPERGLVDVGIDIDDEPVLQLLLGRRGFGQIVARVGTRGNLLELGNPRRGFADIHVSTLR